MTDLVTEETILGDIMKRPNGAKILGRHKLPCLNCPMAALEMGVLKLGDVARLYGLDLKKLLEELNQEEETDTEH